MQPFLVSLWFRRLRPFADDERIQPQGQRAQQGDDRDFFEEGSEIDFHGNESGVRSPGSPDTEKAPHDSMRGLFGKRRWEREEGEANGCHLATASILTGKRRADNGGVGLF